MEDDQGRAVHRGVAVGRRQDHADPAGDAGTRGARGEQAHFSVSHTTRAAATGRARRRGLPLRRPRRRSKRWSAAGEFLEFAEVHGNLYGTSRAEVEGKLERGLRRLPRHRRPGRAPGPRLGARRRSRCSSSRRRTRSCTAASSLAGRTTRATIALRIRNAVQEMREYAEFDYVIINDRLEDATRALASVVAVAQDAAVPHARAGSRRSSQEFERAREEGGVMSELPAGRREHVSLHPDRRQACGAADRRGAAARRRAATSSRPPIALAELAADMVPWRMRHAEEYEVAPASRRSRRARRRSTRRCSSRPCRRCRRWSMEPEVEDEEEDDELEEELEGPKFDENLEVGGGGGRRRAARPRTSPGGVGARPGRPRRQRRHRGLPGRRGAARAGQGRLPCPLDPHRATPRASSRRGRSQCSPTRAPRSRCGATRPTPAWTTSTLSRVGRPAAGRAGHRQRPRQDGRRHRRRRAHDLRAGPPRHGRGGAGDEHRRCGTTPATQAALAVLRDRGAVVVEPVCGLPGGRRGRRGQARRRSTTIVAARARRAAAARRRSRACGCSSPPGRPASRSMPCAC